MLEKSVTVAAVTLWVMSLASVLFQPQQWLHRATLGGSVLVSLLACAARAHKRRVSESWTAATGHVESTEIDKRGDAESHAALHLRSHVLHIAYSYRAQGERYSGFAEQRFFREAQAEEAAARLRGSDVLVRFSPEAPEKSVMDPVAALTALSKVHAASTGIDSPLI
jgi:hypothetical protein